MLAHHALGLVIEEFGPVVALAAVVEVGPAVHDGLSQAVAVVVGDVDRDGRSQKRGAMVGGDTHCV